MEYKLSADEAGLKAAAYSTFYIMWRKLTPHIMVMKPMTDLCWVCQQNSKAIMRAANTPETEVTGNNDNICIGVYCVYACMRVYYKCMCVRITV